MTTVAAITVHHVAHQGVLRIIKSSTRTGDVSFHSLPQSLQVWPCRGSAFYRFSPEILCVPSDTARKRPP